MDNKSIAIVAWAGLVVAVIALFLAFAAYNRNGTDLGDEFSMQSEELMMQLKQQANSWEARARLLGTRAQLALDDDYAAAEVEVAAIRADLRAEYEQASTEARAWWQQVDNQLEQLETDLRNQSADIRASFDAAIDRLRANMSVEGSMIIN